VRFSAVTQIRIQLKCIYFICEILLFGTANVKGWELLLLLLLLYFLITWVAAMVKFKLMEITQLKCSEVLPRCHFLKNIFSGSKHCPTLLDNVCLRVKNRNFRDFGLFNVDYKRPNYLPAACASTANAVDRVTDVFNGRSVSDNDWLVSDTLLHNSEILSRSNATNITSYPLYERS
jgi:hypothetical protein